MKERPLTKYFVFSDVHGEYEALRQGLDQAGYDRNNRNHKLVSLGDAYDRGPDSSKIYEFLIYSNAICVKGNHDTFFQEFLEHGGKGPHVLFNVLHNGLGATIRSFSGYDDTFISLKQLDEVKEGLNRNILRHIKNMPLYFETKNFIFCHAGINPYLPDWKQTSEDFFLWDIKHSHVPVPNTDKTVVIGHHHASKVKSIASDAGLNHGPVASFQYFAAEDERPRGISYVGNTDENAPYVYANKIAIDGMTNLTHKVNILVIEDYPKEGKYIPEETDEVKKNEDNHTEDPSSLSWTVADQGYRVSFAGQTNDPWTYYTTTTTV